MDSNLVYPGLVQSGMAKLYELSLETQVKKLRRTAIAGAVLGAAAFCGLALHQHWLIAMLDAIITVQVTVGSTIMMNDVKKDLQEAQRAATISR
jgi:hypothetical protein